MRNSSACVFRPHSRPSMGLLSRRTLTRLTNSRLLALWAGQTEAPVLLMPVVSPLQNLKSPCRLQPTKLDLTDPMVAASVSP